MTRPSTSPILAQIHNPTSLASQVSALKALKNELIGHEQKKEMWIGLGVVGPVAQLLGHSKTSGKRRTREVNGSGLQGRSPREATEDDEARLQATIIVGSLAFGGPAYIAPLLAASALPPLLAQLSIDEVSPHTVLATLRTLNTIADALLSAHPTSNLSISSLSNALISRQHLQSLTQIISQSSSSVIVHEEVTLAATLIAKTCREERHQTLLANSGVLDALAARLASYVNYTGFNLSGVEQCTPTEVDAMDDLIPQTPRSIQLAPILEAIGIIIADSKYRASQLLYSPAITAVFPPSGPVEHTNPWGIASTTGYSRHTSLNPIDHLLPHVPSSHHKTSSTPFPPLGSSSSRDNLSLGSRPTPGAHPRYSSLTPRSSRLTDQLSATNDILAHLSSQGGIDEDESPLISWLLYVTRAESGMTRLMAAATLAILYRAGLVNKRRETDFAHLLIPILVKMFARSGDSQTQGTPRQIPYEIMERAPTVLALLVTDSGELQKAAVEAHAIKSLSRMLKASFDSIEQPNQPALWAADATNTNTEHRECSTLLLGQAGLSRPLLEKLKLREAALKGLAALAPSNDEYRKMIIETGATPFIVASMKPFGQPSSPSKPAQSSAPQSSNAMATSTSLANSIEGNPASVLIAACGTVRALSRSISILRTSLIDAGVAMPLFALMKSSDIEVKIAASAAICNLVLEFSPMREIIVEAGVLKLICEHAHSSNPRLRLNGVWALKHLVFSADNKVKISCLEELGQGWLVQLICEHSEDSAVGSVEQTEDDEEHSMDLEDAYDMPLEPESQEIFEGDDEMEGGLSMGSSIPRANRVHANPRRSRLSSQSVPSTVNARLAILRDAETNPLRKARRDDIAVQEQGLDFIRNLICGPGSTEMIDVLFKGLGDIRVFEILASKLRPRVINTYGRGKRGSSTSDTRVIQPPGQIVAAVCFIIVHIAAGNPRQRQLLVAQTELLKLLVALFDHPNKNVRAAVAWTVINLTWVDDVEDKNSCRKRAQELRKLGFLSKLETMGQDPELDVRERCKTALFQMENILH